MQDKIILSVDPGREKCGLAVVGKNGGVFLKAIIATALLSERAARLSEEYQLDAIILGDRTSSVAAKKSLLNIKNLPVISVDEHLSSQEARKRYWHDNPPQGLRRFLPVTMQTPPVPIDDYVAVILAERYFSDN